MIKRLIAVSAALMLMISSAGCVSMSFSDFSEFNNDRNTISANGEMTTVDFPCGDFNKLTVSIAGELYYTAEKSDKVTIELPEDLVQYIEVTTDNGTLLIDSTENFNVNNDSRAPKIYVSAPALEKLRIDGAIEIEETDKITADSFTLEIPGVVNGELELEVRDLSVNVGGVGNLTLSGTADKAFINSDGVGMIKAFDLQTKEADVRTSGVGSIEISCSDTLIATVDGIGGITYKGNPNVTPNVDGMGSLKKAG